MPGVVASWNGRCVDRQDQQELCEHLMELSDLSNQIHFKYFKEEMQTNLFDGVEEGRSYLITSRIFGKHVPPIRIKQVDKGIFLGEGMTLYGLDFHLFDPRSHTSPFFHGAIDRISFVFTQSEYPELDGWLVQARPVNKQHRLSTVSQTVLTNPDIGLRYYLEDWTEQFMGWVKHFYVRNLNFWLHRENSSYDAYYGKVSRDRKTATEHFHNLLTAFSDEAESFTELMENMRTKEEAQEGA